MDNAKRNLYARIAYYYYKSALTQEEIAKKMNLSRQKINRVLKECAELGIVEIKVHTEGQYLQLEDAIEKKYGLTAVRVAEQIAGQTVYDALGAAAADYLMGVIVNHDVIGFSRGQSLSALVNSMSAVDKVGVVATQLMGGWNQLEGSGGGDDIVHRFCEKGAAKASFLYTPVVVDSKELRDSIRAQTFFQEAYRVIQSCTIAVVGIGETGRRKLFPDLGENDYSIYYREGNAVGEICGHFYDADGRAVHSIYDERIIAVEPEDFFKIPKRIGVAGELFKVPAIIGAIRGGYINVLITDFETAEALLR